MHTKMDACSGFTLIELALVLVIIGLLISGVLAGKELIEQGKIHSQIKQLADLDRAKSTFQAKYGSLPGDINKTFGGLFQSNCIANRPLSLADGKISSSTPTVISTPPIALYCEPMMFFRHIYEAGLFEQKTFQNCVPTCSFMIGDTSVVSNLSNFGISVGTNSDGFLYYYLAISDDNSANNGSLTLVSTKGVMTPLQANSLDFKLDDGNPTTGGVKSVRNSYATDTILNDCIGNTTSFYNLDSADKNCRLIVVSK